MATLQFPHYHTFDELTAYLRDVAAQHPDLARLDSMGQSYEGRDLWVMTLTNTRTGPDTEKPAYWIDANIHAGNMLAYQCGARLITASTAKIVKTRMYVTIRTGPSLMLRW